MRYRQAMHNTLDVLTFLAYATALGLFVGALLGALALLLASPAHAAGEPGNLLLRPMPDAVATPARLVSSETILQSDGPIQRVRVVQAFRNPLQDRQEGLYWLRLPENATLERVAVSIHGEDDEAADESAEELAPPAPSLALITAETPGVVTRSIAGIEPGELVLVEVEYQVVVRYDRGRAPLRLLTECPQRPTGRGRRRPSSAAPRDPVPLGVEGAWVGGREQPGAPWLWLLPVVGLYVLVAFFS
jgi:hypothetical protein